MISLVRPLSIKMVHLTQEAAAPLVKEALFRDSEQGGALGLTLTLKTCSMLSVVDGVIRLAGAVLAAAKTRLRKAF